MWAHSYLLHILAPASQQEKIVSLKAYIQAKSRFNVLWSNITKRTSSISACWKYTILNLSSKGLKPLRASSRSMDSSSISQWVNNAKGKCNIVMHSNRKDREPTFKNVCDVKSHWATLRGRYFVFVFSTSRYIATLIIDKKNLIVITLK